MQNVFIFIQIGENMNFKSTSTVDSNLTLSDKLAKINYPQPAPLENGYVNTIKEFYDTFILQHMFDKDSVLKIHRALLEYVKMPDAVFAIRKFFTEAKPERYGMLRRGWLTRTKQGYSFFYTDNFHAAYYAKLVSDKYPLTAFELLETYKQRKFPSRYGPWTHQEKEQYAVKEGRDPGFNKAGYKIAHILATADDNYEYNGQPYKLDDIVTTYFDKGEREDWEQKHGYWLRDDFEVSEEAKKFLIAHFLRFVDPLNYVLLPKKTCETFGGLGIAEYQPLLDYIRIKLHQIYAKEYEEFLKLIMAPSAPVEADGAEVIDLHYGLNIAKNNQSKTSKIVSPAKKTTKSKTSSSPRDLQTMGVSWFVSYEYCRRIDSTHNNWKLATKQSSRLSAYRNREGDNKTRYNYLEQICLKSAKRLSLNEMELDGAQVLNMAIELVKYYEKYKLI